MWSLAQLVQRWVDATTIGDFTNAKRKIRLFEHAREKLDEGLHAPALSWDNHQHESIINEIRTHAIISNATLLHCSGYWPLQAMKMN